jgi:hypothetical protein
MTSWLFIGPSLLSGIGQVTLKYCKLVNGDFITYGGGPPKESYDVGFSFVLPIKGQLEQVDELMKRCKKKMYMSVCETETVHPAYEMLEKYKPLYVSIRIF